ncbi:hypothetical protein IAQ61_011986, partial [Plenodomus lingam]|uniref:uncharacterized protein n=1 Tax=Leptosphaeria maculans TaxID=5022 RepID=UPI003320A752
HIRTRSSSSINDQLLAFLQHQNNPNCTNSHPRSRKSSPTTTKSTMSFLLPGLRRGLMLSTPFILSTPLLAHQLRNTHRIRCDAGDPFSRIKSDLTGGYTSEAQTPIITQSGAVNPRAIRQVSMGSILGVLGGLGISVFSKPLAILIGLGIFVLQFVESRGIHIIPYSYLQRRFQSANVKSIVRDNVAFKLSFGLTFALAAFAEF